MSLQKRWNAKQAFEAAAVALKAAKSSNGSLNDLLVVRKAVAALGWAEKALEGIQALIRLEG